MRLLGLLLAIGGCFAALSIPARAIPLLLRISFALLALSVTLILEAPALRKPVDPAEPFPDTPDKPAAAETAAQDDTSKTPAASSAVQLIQSAVPASPQLPTTAKQPRKPYNAYRVWLQAALILLLALGTDLIARGGGTCNAGCSQVCILKPCALPGSNPSSTSPPLLDSEVQKSLLEYLKRPPAASAPSQLQAAPPLQLDTSLQKALLDYLQRPPVASTPAQSIVQLNQESESLLRDWIKRPQATQGSLYWPWFLVIIIAVAMLGAFLFKHKEAAGEVASTGLAAATVALALEAIKHPEHLSYLEDAEVYKHYILWPFIILIMACALPFIVLAWRTAFGKGLKSEGGEKIHPLASLSFSVLTLLWALVIIGHRPQDTPSQGAAPHTAVKVSIEEVVHSPQYIRGQTTVLNTSASSDLKTSLQQARPSQGSALLLFGSTDCYRFKRGSLKTNDALAQDRAESLKTYLRDLSDQGLDIQALHFQQHAQCAESPELRAVYPFLIQAVEIKP